MGKVILEFDSIEEQTEIQTALDAWKWKAVVCEIDQELRGFAKHGISCLDSKKEATEEELTIVERICEEIRNKLNEYNLHHD